VKKYNRRATVTWGLVILGALSMAVVACGSPNWQNQYTETPYFTGAAEAPDGSTSSTDDSGSAPCPGARGCYSTLSTAPSASGGIPPIFDPQGNPDPVPWSEPHPYQ